MKEGAGSTQFPQLYQLHHDLVTWQSHERRLEHLLCAREGLLQQNMLKLKPQLLYLTQKEVIKERTLQETLNSLVLDQCKDFLAKSATFKYNYEELDILAIISQPNTGELCVH